MKLDVIIPAYNEELIIPTLYEELKKALKDIKYTLIFVNDGSTDNTEQIFEDIYNKDKNHIKIINFSRNFGKDAAIYAGLQKSTAEYTSIIDADMQQNPIYLKEMLDILENDKTIDEVAMVNNYKKNGFFEKFAKESFYKVINKLSGLKFKPGASDFRMFRKYVTKAIINMSEKNRFSKGLFSYVGFNIKYLDYNADKRTIGKSKFKFKKQISYATDGIINFSIKPLKMVSVLGITISISSLIALIITLITIIIDKIEFNLIIILTCISLLIGGITLFSLAIISEYVSKIYIETKNRPVYIEKNTLGFDDNIL